MATAIRLKRVGAKKQASYRIVVTDSRTADSGPSIERLGIYNPRTSPSLIKLDAARTVHWLQQGATPSDTVRSLLRQTGVWEQYSRGVAPEELAEPLIELGPQPGQRTTSQRPAPVEKAMRGGNGGAAPAAAAAAPAVEKAVEEAAEAETAEAETAEAETAEAETEEAAAEAEEVTAEAEVPAAEVETEEAVAEAETEGAAAEAEEVTAEAEAEAPAAEAEEGEEAAEEDEEKA